MATKNLIIWLFRCVGQMVSPTPTGVLCVERPVDLVRLSSAVIMDCAGGLWDFVKLGKSQSPRINVLTKAYSVVVVTLLYL